MTTEQSLQAYRDSSDPSIAISDAQAAWISPWGEQQRQAGYEKALAEVLAYIPNIPLVSINCKKLRQIIHSLSPTEDEEKVVTTGYIGEFKGFIWDTSVPFKGQDASPGGAMMLHGKMHYRKEHEEKPSSASMKIICLDCEIKGSLLTLCDYHMKNGCTVGHEEHQE